MTGVFSEDAGSGALVATTYTGQADQGFELRKVAGEEGTSEVARMSDGKCLRLDGTLLTLTMGNRQCQYIDWLTPLSMGSFDDEWAWFSVVAWDGDTEFRPRQRFPCTKGGEPAGYDDSSSVDSDGWGSSTLRVFWCHDGDRDRQRLVAPGWPAFPGPGGQGGGDAGNPADSGTSPDAETAPYGGF